MLMIFHRSQGDSKSPRVSRTLLSILVDHNNSVVWMVSILSPIYDSSSPFPRLWEPFQVPTTFLVLWQGLSTFRFFHFLHASFFPFSLPFSHIYKIRIKIPKANIKYYFDSTAGILEILTNKWQFLAYLRRLIKKVLGVFLPFVSAYYYYYYYYLLL